MFEDFGLIEARYATPLPNTETSLEEKVTEDAIQLGAEDVEIVDAATAAVNVSNQSRWDI